VSISVGTTVSVFLNVNDLGKDNVLNLNPGFAGCY
jgi:hypothetical protein